MFKLIHLTKRHSNLRQSLQGNLSFLLKLHLYEKNLKMVNGETISACDARNLEKFAQMLNEVHLARKKW